MHPALVELGFKRNTAHAVPRESGAIERSKNKNVNSVAKQLEATRARVWLTS